MKQLDMRSAVVGLLLGLVLALSLWCASEVFAQPRGQGVVGAPRREQYAMVAGAVFGGRRTLVMDQDTGEVFYLLMPHDVKDFDKKPWKLEWRRVVNGPPK